MSDQPSPEVRELAAKLFAAARAEQPSPALGRRLLLLEPTDVEHVAASRRAGRSLRSQGVLPARSRLLRGLAAAALLASGVGLWLLLERDAPELSISAERALGRPPASEPEPSVVTTPAPPPPLVHEAQRAASETAPQVEAAERVVPKRSLPARRREAPRPDAVDTAAPPRPAPSERTSSAAPVSAKPMTLLGELELLKRARAALRSGKGGQALELLDRHASERSGNGLDAEATLLRIEALAAVGRHGEASALAARFVRENPNSALGDRAKSFIGAAAPKAP